MDNFFTDNPVISISNGIIQEISSGNSATLFVTVSYSECMNCRKTDYTVRLVVGNDTVILNERGNVISAGELRVGMTINASFSSAMTRSISPQARAFMIQIIKGSAQDNITIGRRTDFSGLIPGLRVRIRHASFMTASIPPQTTAFEIWTQIPNNFIVTI